MAQHHQNNFNNDPNTERLWASRYFLQIKSLKEMRVLVTELTERLERMGIRKQTGVQSVQWSPAEKSIILKCIIAGECVLFCPELPIEIYQDVFWFSQAMDF